MRVAAFKTLKQALAKETGVLSGIVNAQQIQGKELSFNNILDLESAYNCCREFLEPACVIVKHLNPCGVAMCCDTTTAFVRAREADPVSSFGGIVAFNTAVTKKTALILAETFFEAIVAPCYDDDALSVLSNKKNLRVMRLDNAGSKEISLDYRRVGGGMLVQNFDNHMIDINTGAVVTEKKPSPEQISDLNFAWRVVKHVKSNAIVFAKDQQSLGVGAGQMSRVDSVKLAVIKAKENFKNDHILHNAVMASDAFFPFRDGIDTAAKAGIKAIVQPGGSMRDKEVIDACNEHGISMVFTGIRHFRH
ncbi:MAG: bifunctional phosphoribosylaminoimidazolecarboxamide formyltransferase/IMP cyclohydrolase [Deltaproteobacteria bacterium]|nr:bifunctional phosphoribosylaminoimidazolecarboxamide formyltransferase/IMP cyclohydrolase [Deltaproteobacteria bacterium]